MFVLDEFHLSKYIFKLTKHMKDTGVDAQKELYDCIRAGKIANKCERNFPAFLVLGLSLLLVTQAFVNMMVAVGLFPVTGQPLPLVSKGGSSTLINCLYIGMILSVSRFAKRRVTSTNQRQEVATAVNEDEFTRTDGMA